MKEPEKKPPKSKLLSAIKAIMIASRTRSHAEAIDQLTTHLEDTGAQKEFIPIIREYFIALREMRRDDESFHRINRYLVGGIGGIDLLLFSMIIPIGTPDIPTFIALLALVISLPVASTFLFMSFLKEANGITTYGRVHSTLSTITLYSGIAAMTALIWHISLLDGIAFLCLTIVLYNVCAFYVAILAFRKHLERRRAATMKADQPTTTESPKDTQ